MEALSEHQLLDVIKDYITLSSNVRFFFLIRFTNFLLKQSTHATLLDQGGLHVARGISRIIKSLCISCSTAIKPKHLTSVFMVLNNPEVLIKMKADIGMKDPPH